MTWFERLTGINEDSPERVRANISVDGTTLKSHANGATFEAGKLVTPSLGQLRELVESAATRPGRLSIREVVSNVQELHADPANAGSLFQVASQFNLLEMASPRLTPEYGVGLYEYDPTQGPGCAIAAGAGTIYRNYFVDVNGKTGQSTDNQIDCLADIGAALGNSDGRLWEMRNGYALASKEGLTEISAFLAKSSESETDRLRALLRIGIQWNTQVTLEDAKHAVSQAYCSALPVAYSIHSPELWAAFARLVLEASYEATICAAIVNLQQAGNGRVYLTLLGGGAFGNDADWILEAIDRAVTIYRDFDLDVVIVSYGGSKPLVQQLVSQINSR